MKKEQKKTVLFVALILICGTLPLIPKGYAGELIPFPKTPDTPAYQGKKEPAYYNEFRIKIARLNCPQLLQTYNNLQQMVRKSTSRNEFAYYQGLMNILSQEMFEKQCRQGKKTP